ncbi:MAG: hypothetical protein IJ772_05370 [Bacilli bacterium]|nr:hypothetical protein [Bacilli bacterium]
MVSNTLYVKDAYINTTIYDDSIAQPVEAIIPKRLTILQPIFAGKGKANKILPYSTSSLVKAMYGNDMENLDLYGQGGINLIHGMSGGASAHVCRLLPDNAKTAAVLVKLVLTEKGAIPVYQRDSAGDFVLDENGNKIQKVVDGNPVTTPGLKVKIVVTDTDPTSVNDGKITSAVAETVKVGPEPEEGAEDKRETLTYNEYQIPLYKLIYNGPGKCGNSMGFSLDNDEKRDDMVSNGRRYLLTLWEKDESGNASIYGSQFSFSLNPKAVLTEGSEVYENLQYVYSRKDAAGNERIVQCSPYIMNNWDTLAGLIGKYTEEEPYNIDIINGIDKETGTSYDWLVFDEDSAIMEDDAVYYLRGGSDGSLEEGATIQIKENGVVSDHVVTAEDVVSMKKTLLKNFFYGQIDPALFDERLVPADIVVDANYDYSIVKPAMLGKFRAIRPDIMVIADIGTDAQNCDQAIALLKANYGMVDGSMGWSAATIIHAGYTTDRALPLHLTGTYDYIYGLARCYAERGTFSMFCGYQTAPVRTMEFDFYPYKDEYDTMLGPFKKLGCIYAMEVFPGQYYYMCEDNMYSYPTSKLKSLRNGMIIGDAVRLGKEVLIKYVYDPDGTAGAINHATAEMNEKILGRYPDSIIVTPSMYQTERDQLLESCTCDMIYKFPGMPKDWSLNIYAKRADAA